MKNNSIILISSPDSFVINKKVNDIISKYKRAEIVKYDMFNTNVEEAITNIDTYNFLSDKKIIILENTFFLSSIKNPEKIEHNIDLFKKYLDNPNPDNILIITCNSIDNKKNIVKTLVDKYQTYIDIDYNINSIIEEHIEDYKIDKLTINYLINYLNYDKYRIVNELEKLKLLKKEEKEITKLDIDNNCIKEIDEDFYKLVDAIIDKNKKKAYETYKSIVLKTNDDSGLLSGLSNKFRLFYQVKKLSLKNLTDKEIGIIINSHPYPVKLAREKVNRYSETDLIKILDKLASIEIDKKMGNINQENNLEMFLLTL